MARRCLLLLIAAYRLTLRPVLGRHCRFFPSCSTYAERAITKYGARKGGKLALKRLLCCHPWHKGGFDPVP
ncbi:MAG: membrane protein insertion efficiency factor YidD [Zoogloeaceae bacterium]|nr:membrane protein insertion efficiency factor YidD [Zoogloeaceae bacterium]